MLEKDDANLEEILVCAQKILDFVKPVTNAEALVADLKTYDAVMMNFVLIGEAVSRLSDNLKSSQQQVDWANIKGFRNLIVHDYMGIDEHEVWSIINLELPVLIKDITSVIKKD
ncbi:MAG: DUF86 domain-containing protein [Bacteroidetes bacterium]|nr:DUF86 domain-containing protein [Bacteroidota bacterium]MBK8659148.1 DUF86 domain-containing protein [Bacteroidota bacterium]